MSLDRSHLELLAALAEHSTLAAASAQINLSASAASRRLQDAERRLGMRLVELDGRTLQLTAAGRVLADAATTVIDQLAEAELAARWLGAGEQAPVRVGVGFHDQLTWVLPAQSVATWELVRSPTSQAVEALTRRGVDVVIDVAGHGRHDGRTLVDDHLVLCTAVDHRLANHSTVSAVDLEDERYLASDPTPLPGFEFEQLFVPSRHSPRVIHRVESFAVSMDLISRGEGVSIQPRLAVLGAGRKDLQTVALDRTIPVQWFSQRADDPSPLTDALIESVADSMRAAKGRW